MPRSGQRGELNKSPKVKRSGKKSRAGRPIDPRLHDAWLEWEMTPQGKVLGFELDPFTDRLVPRFKEQLRPTFRKLAEKYFGDPSKRDDVKKRITRLHRQLKDH